MGVAVTILGKLHDFTSLFGLKRRKVPPFSTAGHPGTSLIGGMPQNIEGHGRLSGREKYKTFSEILANTAIVAAGTRFFLDLVSKATWKVEPNEEGGERAVEVAKLIEQILFKDMLRSWRKVVRRSSMYRFYGFSVQEWTALRRDDGAIGYLDISPRSQMSIERWDQDHRGHIIGMMQRSPTTSEELYLPRDKVVYLVDDALNDSPEGLGLFRHVAEPSRQLARYEQLEGYGYETDLRGVPIGRAPLAELAEMVRTGKLSAEDKKAMEDALKSFIENHVKSPSLGLLLDSIPYQSLDESGKPSNVKQWDIDLLKSHTTSQADVARAIERKNREIARILGVESMLLGESASGSFAMARDKSANFALIVDSSLQELAEVYDNDVLGPLMSLNGWGPELRPTLIPEKMKHRTVQEITAALRDLGQAGAQLDPREEAVAEIFELLGLSKPEFAEQAVAAAEQARQASLTSDNTKE